MKFTKRYIVTFIFCLFSIFSFGQYERLQETLNINDAQMACITVTTNNILSASEDISNGVAIRENLKAIRKNIKFAKKQLNKEQFELYIKLIFTTVRNDELESRRYKIGREVH